jgi:uncharacterized protein YxjI
MKLYMKQKVFSLRDKFSVFDENQNILFTAQGAIFSFGRKITICGADGHECAYIKQKIFTLLRRYIIDIDSVSHTVVKELTLLKPSFHVENNGWTVKGDIWEHSYEIKYGEEVIMSLSKHWLTWGDSYELDIPDDKNVLLALCTAIAIDCMNADTKQSAYS